MSGQEHDQGTNGWNDPPKSCFSNFPRDNSSKFDYRRRGADMRARNAPNISEQNYMPNMPYNNFNPQQNVINLNPNDPNQMQMPATNPNTNFHSNFSAPHNNMNNNISLTNGGTNQLVEFIVAKYSLYMKNMTPVHMIPIDHQNQLIQSFKQFIYGNSQNMIFLNEMSSLFQDEWRFSHDDIRSHMRNQNTKRVANKVDVEEIIQQTMKLMAETNENQERGNIKASSTIPFAPSPTLERVNVKKGSQSNDTNEVFIIDDDKKLKRSVSGKQLKSKNSFSKKFINTLRRKKMSQPEPPTTYNTNPTEKTTIKPIEFKSTQESNNNEYKTPKIKSRRFSLRKPPKTNPKV